MAESPTFLPETQRGRSWLLLVAGWGAFFILWTLFLLGWGQGETPLSAALISGLVTTGTAAILGVAVWKLTDRLVWPDDLRLSFFLWQLIAAVIFSAAWTASAPIIFALIEGGGMSDIRWDVQNTTWRLFMGVWLYFMVVGVSYSLRINRRLQDQRELAMQAESLAAKAGLQAMRSQLQPHFLFNALHSVGSLIETDRESAMDGMERLGDLLRYTIRERDEDRVELSEEWAFVQDYIALQELRFGDRIRVEADFDSSCMTHQVPPFLIQPLVENAFVHGPGSRSSGGLIRVAGSCREGVLTIVVEDDGPGLTGESGGSGLTNLRSRLEAIYGDRSALSVAERKGGGVRVEIMLSLDD
jgi:signal transduction histidine kinase